MIKPLDALGELDDVFDEMQQEPSFTRIKSSHNRTMPVRSHASTNNGRRRFGAKRPKSSKAGMQRRFNKKVLHAG